MAQSILHKDERGELVMFNIILQDYLQRGTVMRESGTTVGIMAMEITQSIGLVGVNILRVLGYS